MQTKKQAQTLVGHSKLRSSSDTLLHKNKQAVFLNATNGKLILTFINNLVYV